MDPSVSAGPPIIQSVTLTVPQLAVIPLFPLLAFVVLVLFGRRASRLSGWLAVSALAASGLVTLALGRAVFSGARLAMSWPWLPGGPRWMVGLAVDGLSWIMLVVVTLIGTCIAIYSIGYMHADERCSRFFAYFSLFCASMLTLVMADHFLLLYIGWELVGLCSYLLIGFWFEKPAAAEASRKAFLTTRIGDTGLLLGILLLAWTSGELHFAQLGFAREALSSGLRTLISTLIFFGAVGKSAQFPLHVWLPDAMEGPTPVSALIHAATMVAAGVYLVARTFALFTPASCALVLALGLTTHLFAATVALTQTDIKRILAYSTLSQLGLMMSALGIGAVAAAMFHLFTHAFFKALLFLGAGSVIHATHQQDLAHLGALRRAMPVTAAVFLIAALSMGGGIFLSGFWSKDAILIAARHAHPWLLWVLLGGATMTSGYAFRLYLRCFHGPDPRAAGHGDHRPHESPSSMTLPMVVLAVGAALAGMAGSPWSNHLLFRLLGVTEAHGLDVPILLLSTAALALGFWLALRVGVQRRNLLPAELRPLGSRLYRWAANKYYVDEAYARVVIRPCIAGAAWLARWDQRVIDGAVNGAGWLGVWVSRWKERFDRLVVDGLVNGIAALVRGCGVVGRRLQTGIIQQYLLVVVIAAVVLSAVVRR